MKNLLLAILATVCLFSVVAPVQACKKCESTYTAYYRAHAYAYAVEPVYTVTYRFKKCNEDCCIPIPEPRCEVTDWGLVTYKTTWCKCGCNRECHNEFGNKLRTDKEVTSMPSKLDGWLYIITLPDGTERSYIKEAVQKNGEWNATGRLWYYVK